MIKTAKVITYRTLDKATNCECALSIFDEVGNFQGDAVAAKLTLYHPNDRYYAEIWFSPIELLELKRELFGVD